jgi:ABC-2 type transport system ATP-binding protein
MTALSCTQLERSYGGTRALDGVSFSLEPGALCALIGPNGAGKTTLLSILATLDEDFAGDASVAGASVRKEPLEARRKLGFVPDHAPLYDALDVHEMLHVFASAAAVPRGKRKRAVDDVVDLCGLEPILRRPAAGLSKGQAQRVCVARALLHDPDVLLLDEPASGLDPRARIDLKELLKKLGARKKTVLVSSHILTELGDFCDHVVILERGRVAASGRIEELTANAGGAQAPRRVLVEVEGDAPTAERVLRAFPEVKEVFVDGQILGCVVEGPRALHARMVRALGDAGLGVLQLVPEKANLEALFLTVTRADGGAA